MASSRRAVIDVGTNSVKLLVADVEGADIRPIVETATQTRLGLNFYRDHRLQPDAIQATLSALSTYVEQAHAHGAKDIRIISTSAVRDAVNQSEFAAAVQVRCGIGLKILSGAQEAALAYAGVASDPHLHQHPLFLIDVGGGSTEIILGQAGESRTRVSFALGTVRLLERMPPGDPPTKQDHEQCRELIREILVDEVVPALDGSPETGSGDMICVGTGGSATILARVHLQLGSYDRAKIDNAVISRESLDALADRLWSLSLAERKQVVGLPPSRADVFLMGVQIYQEILRQFQFIELHITSRGLRFAALQGDPESLG